MARRTPITRSAVIIAMALIPAHVAAEAGLRGPPAATLSEKDRDDSHDKTDLTSIVQGLKGNLNQLSEKPQRHLDSETTTRPPKTDYTSIVHGLEENLNKQLRSEKFQWVNALLAFAFGWVLLFNGEATLKMVIVSGAFVLAGTLAMADISAAWNLPEGDTIRLVVGCEVGLLAAFGTYMGIEGVLVCLWAAAGAFVACGLEKRIVHKFDHFDEDKWHVVAVYTACVAIALLFFSTGKHRRFVALVSAFLGGALLVSALSWAITEFYLQGSLAFLDSAFPGIHPQGGDWIDFLKLLSSSDNPEDVGIFAGSSYNFDLGGKWHLDRTVGVLTWLVLLLCGTKYQWEIIREDYAMGRSDTGFGKTANARECLSHPLLTQE